MHKESYSDVKFIMLYTDGCPRGEPRLVEYDVGTSTGWIEILFPKMCPSLIRRSFLNTFMKIFTIFKRIVYF